jgi:hypothetical protein
MRKKLLVSFVLIVLLLGSFSAVSADPGKGKGPKEKVTICHKPGTPAEKTMEVPPEAVPGHLGHGDYLGACTTPEPPVDPPVNPDEPGQPDQPGQQSQEQYASEWQPGQPEQATKAKPVSYAQQVCDFPIAEEQKLGELRIVKVDVENLQVIPLIDGDEQYIDPAWSQSCGYITVTVYYKAEDRYALAYSQPDGSGLTEIKDGAISAVESHGNDAGYIVAVDTDSGEIIVVDRTGQGWSTGEIGNNPEWLDDTTISFDRDGIVYTMQPHGENVTRQFPGYAPRQVSATEYVYYSAFSPSQMFGYDTSRVMITDFIPEMDDMAIQFASDQFVGVYRGKLVYGGNWHDAGKRSDITRMGDAWYEDVDW